MGTDAVEAQAVRGCSLVVNALIQTAAAFSKARLFRFRCVPRMFVASTFIR